MVLQTGTLRRACFSVGGKPGAYPRVFEYNENMDSDWHRFTYWLSQDWPGVLQALCAAATVYITYVLARMNKRYIELTREQVENAQRQTKLLMQPNLNLFTNVKKLARADQRVDYTVELVIENKGAYPVLVSKATVSWQVNMVGERVEKELGEFRERVIPAQEQIADDRRLDIEWLSEDDYGPFSDFLWCSVWCSDITGLFHCKYSYRPVSGLYYEPIIRSDFQPQP